MSECDHTSTVTYNGGYVLCQICGQWIHETPPTESDDE